MTSRTLRILPLVLTGILLSVLFFVTPATAQEKKPDAPPPKAGQPAKADQPAGKTDKPESPAGKTDKTDQASKPAGDKRADPNLVPLALKLPKPAFQGTPAHIPPGTNLEKPRKGPRPPLQVPKGTELLSLNKPVSSSDKEPIVGSLKMVTDGDKEAGDGTYVELGPGMQYVQIDLGKKCDIYAVVVWHYHGSPRIYHDVVVQVADDADFITNVRPLFNNDHDNSSGLGVGKELEYWETYEGKLIDAKSATARYVRLYSKGSTADDQNHYTEVEVYGRPAK